MDARLLLRALRSAPVLEGSDPAEGDSAAAPAADGAAGSSVAFSSDDEVASAILGRAASRHVSVAALSRCLRALPGSSRPSAIHMYEGVEYRGKRQMHHVRQCKKHKCEIQTLQEENKNHDTLEGVWKNGVLRVGDCMKADDKGSAHPNTYMPESVLRHAWQIVGRSTHLRGVVDGSHRGLEMLAVSSASAWLSQCDYVKEKVDLIKLHQWCPFLQRNYDASRNRMAMGRLQSRIAPHARYCVRDTKDGPWKIVGFEEFKKHFGGKGANPRWGILELLAQHSTLTWSDDTDLFCGIQLFHRPQIVQRANASCIYRAVDFAVPALTPDGLSDLCSAVHHCFVNEQPDGRAFACRQGVK